MFKRLDKNADRKVRHYRVRKKISGTPERPRLNVYRSLNHIYCRSSMMWQATPWLPHRRWKRR